MLKTLMLLVWLGAAAQAGVAREAQTPLQAELQRHKVILAGIKSLEIDAKMKYRNAVIGCGRDLGCMGTAKQRWVEQQGVFKMMRNEEDARFKSNRVMIAAQGHVPIPGSFGGPVVPVSTGSER